MGMRVIYVMTHDSIGLGEDGPTHQPVEHLAALRAIPNLLVLRPADAVETLECWQIALETTDGAVDPRAHPPEPAAAAHRIRRGEPLAPRAPTSSPRDGDARRSRSSPPAPKSTIAVDARDLLQKDGIPAQVVSVPSMRTLRGAGRGLPREGHRQAQGQGRGRSRHRDELGQLLGDEGRFVGMHSSAPARRPRRSTSSSASRPKPLLKPSRRSCKRAALRRFPPFFSPEEPSWLSASQSMVLAASAATSCAPSSKATATRHRGRRRQRSRPGRDQRPPAALRQRARPLPARGEGRRRHHLDRQAEVQGDRGQGPGPAAAQGARRRHRARMHRHLHRARRRPRRTSPPAPRR